MNRKPTPKDYITAAGTVLSAVKEMQPAIAQLIKDMCTTIIPTIIRAIALSFYLRIKLWVKRNKGCCRCCIICKYFNECKNDF